MARNYIDIGPVPCEESCQQVGTPDYDPSEARRECQRFIRNIRHVLGNEPEGAELRVKSNQHDFGSYLEVVCYYDENNETAANYAYKCESEAPANWVVV